MTLLLLLASCAHHQNIQSAVVLERNSPAIGDGGTLVEDVGIETIGGVFAPLLNRGCKVPCRDASIFSTAQDNQNRIQVSLFRGKEKLVPKNHSLGVCYIVAIQPAPRGFPQIELTVEAVEKEIRVSALDKATNKTLAIECAGKPAN